MSDIIGLGEVKPDYFDEPDVLAGLHEAMLFGAPVEPGDRATFYVPIVSTVVGTRDDEDVPLDIAVRPTRTHTPIQVPCAVEWNESEVAGRTGTYHPTRVTLTILGPDYDKIVGFEYVVIAGAKYFYRQSPPPVALGTFDVWTVLCQAEDES